MRLQELGEVSYPTPEFKAAWKKLLMDLAEHLDQPFVPLKSHLFGVTSGNVSVIGDHRNERAIIRLGDKARNKRGDWPDEWHQVNKVILKLPDDRWGWLHVPETGIMYEWKVWLGQGKGPFTR